MLQYINGISTELMSVVNQATSKNDANTSAILVISHRIVHALHDDV